MKAHEYKAGLPSMQSLDPFDWQSTLDPNTQVPSVLSVLSLLQGYINKKVTFILKTSKTAFFYNMSLP